MQNFNKLTKKALIEQLTQTSEALKRERADAINNRQRVAKDKQLLRQSAQQDILTRLLPLIDNLDRAFKHVPSQIEDNNWVKGILQIEQQLNTQLAELGVKPMVVLHQPFDPNFMEALASVDSSHPAQTVIEEVTKGYLIGDQVLRIAQVKVAK